MEVYPKSSWFLLLLGFALIAGNLQGVQGEADIDGPSESDCRPYIEKALKELETSEVTHTQTSNKDDSTEDIPTVEITDDSSHQEEGGRGNSSEESDIVDEHDIVVEKQDTLHIVQEDSKSEENILELTEAQKSEEEIESEENTKSEPSKEASGKKDDDVDRTSVKGGSKENEDHLEFSSETSQEESELQEPTIIKRELPVENVKVEPIQEAVDDEKDDQSVEEEDKSNESGEKSEAISENDGKIDDIREAAKLNQESEETKYASEEDNNDSDGNKSDEDEKEKSIEEKSDKGSISKENTSPEEIEENGCPPPEQVSCTEGDLCNKHKHCGEKQICCPNKCYRKRCILGSVLQEELDAESESEESEENNAQDVTTPDIPETGCPAPDEVSCTEGELCNKHKLCGDGKICCPNKCYRKRCIDGIATSAELAAEESDEVSEEDSKEKKASEEVTKSTRDTGCPTPSHLSCIEGVLCNKHKECEEGNICCVNKCYRKRCTPGTPTEHDLEDEESEEDSKEQEIINKQNIIIPKKDVGCPEREEIPCTGSKCAKNKECSSGEICCTSKCYRKVCVPGTPGSEESDEDEESSEDSRKKEESTESENESIEIQEQETNCPSKQKVSCTDGQRCGDDDDCDHDEICCPNTCYTRRCVSGPTGRDRDSLKEELKEKLVEKLISPSRVRDEPSVDLDDEIKVKTSTVPPVQQTETKKISSSSSDQKQTSHPPPTTSKSIPRSPKIKPEIKKPMIMEPPDILKIVEEITTEEIDESYEKDGQAPVEDLSLDTDIPVELRPRDHVEHLLKLDRESSKIEQVQNKVYEETLKEVKKVYESAIKPLEVLYKYRDLSNRHFGDAEIFSKPLILFMGPWSGGKSSIINYLVNNEYNETSLRTGAEPSPAYFNLLLYGNEPEIIDGTELAADFTFSGLQKFGQGLEERLRGIKLPAKLLERVNIVEIPGILEVRKQVSRVFPFNDACQWFIDRADIIFLVYDPAKLDVGPETEAILDQLKGREHQTRIILNKADQVKPEELMRVQGALIWNISPLMSSPQPPIMYTTSLWSRPYESWAPTRLLQAQERAFLRDLRTSVDRRVENKIASARRFAVRVRNHAKMVDCYLTTYYNHKSVFGNRKQVANEIIEHPQNYHIYEGLSTLTNISRYDLPDPDVYKDFFKLNPLYEFQQLSATCTYFRGCPINRLDIAIAYDLPELIGTYKRNIEEALTTANNGSESPQKSKKSAPGS